MDKQNIDEGLIILLLSRLERVSADSSWAHKASGVRGALHQILERNEKGGIVDPGKAQKLIDYGFNLLEKAARKFK